MRRWSSCAAFWLATLIAAAVQAAAPYPQSSLTAEVQFEAGSYLWSSQGSDIWPITWADNGNLYTAWGDGNMSCPAKASYGVAVSTSGSPSAGLTVRHCGPGPQDKGKMMAIIAVGNDLYTRFNPQSTGTGHLILKSTDLGATWTRPASPMSFPIENFVQFGKGNAGAPGGYVYALESRTTSINLLRVPVGGIQNELAYEYFSGTPTSPAWSSRRSDARPIFSNPEGIGRPTITYVPGLDRYVLAAAHTLSPGTSGGNTLGLFESRNLYGPWSTMYYASSHLGMRGGHYLGTNFPVKWQADGGATLWATFSCHNKGDANACGQYHDRFNVMKVTLRLGGTAPGPTANPDSDVTIVGTPVTIDVLANDTGNGLTVASVTTPANGTTRINSGATITYTPRAGYSGSDSFSYTIRDGNARTSSALVSLTVRAGTLQAEYLGCFADVGGINNLEEHDLDGFFFQDGKMTLQLCTSRCAQEGFPFAGARNGFRCFCGATAPSFPRANTCNVGCYGDRSQTCGGFSVNSVYRSD